MTEELKHCKTCDATLTGWAQDFDYCNQACYMTRNNRTIEAQLVESVNNAARYKEALEKIQWEVKAMRDMDMRHPLLKFCEDVIPNALNIKED